MSRTDDGSVCPKSMNGEHCQHFYYDWEPAPLEGHHEGHGGPHCCYCDRDRDRLLSENAVVEALEKYEAVAVFPFYTGISQAIAIVRALPSALSPPEGPT